MGLWVTRAKEEPQAEPTPGALHGEGRPLAVAVWTGKGLAQWMCAEERGEASHGELRTEQAGGLGGKGATVHPTGNSVETGW